MVKKNGIIANRIAREGTVKPDRHLEKAESIQKSLKNLLPDEEGRNVEAIVELCYGIVQHLIACRIHRTLYGYQMKTRIKDKMYEVAKEGLVSGANEKLGPGTVILTLNAWSRLEGIFEQLKVKYVKYKIWQDE